ncbi:MAG TPA: hypothetical protein VJB59_09830 [Bdellovibrionota bacterium]|nr:hypothetical protein [Bdellovibrionota bacterium]
MMESYREQMCNEEAGYQQGMNDARDDKPMNMEFAGSCDSADQNKILHAYRTGYDSGLSSVSRQKPASIININLGTTPGPEQRSYYCEVEAFASKFSAFGPTKLEATQNVQAQCTARYNEMHCSDVKCRHNR